MPERGAGAIPQPARPLALVADDEPDVCALVAEILDDAGFTTITATDGLDLLDLAERHRPALVVVDVMMPRMDGYSAIARLRGRRGTAGIPVIVMTGRADPAYRLLSERIGVAAHVTKPFSLPDFARLARQVVKGTGG